jgi:hypothetical protein
VIIIVRARTGTLSRFATLAAIIDRLAPVSSRKRKGPAPDTLTGMMIPWPRNSNARGLLPSATAEQADSAADMNTMSMPEDCRGHRVES